MLANDIAFYMGWLGHYVADAAQPLHNSFRHDGWSSENSKGHTRSPEIHGRFESRYVDLIEVTAADIVKHMRKEPRRLEGDTGPLAGGSGFSRRSLPAEPPWRIPEEGRS